MATTNLTTKQNNGDTQYMVQANKSSGNRCDWELGMCSPCSLKKLALSKRTLHTVSVIIERLTTQSGAQAVNLQRSHCSSNTFPASGIIRSTCFGCCMSCQKNGKIVITGEWAGSVGMEIQRSQSSLGPPIERRRRRAG